MAESTWTVPARYVETLRDAVVDDVQFWARGVRQDTDEIREARERHDEDRASFLTGDLRDHQRALADSAALVAQLPPPGADVDAELTGRPAQLMTIAQEATRFCIKAMNSVVECDPLDGDAAWTKYHELEFWLREYELLRVDWLGENHEAKTKDEAVAA